MSCRASVHLHNQVNIACIFTRRTTTYLLKIRMTMQSISATMLLMKHLVRFTHSNLSTSIKTFVSSLRCFIYRFVFFTNLDAEFKVIPKSSSMTAVSFAKCLYHWGQLRSSICNVVITKSHLSKPPIVTIPPAATTSTSATMPSLGFLSLPPEIRCEIYRHYFTDAKAEVHYVSHEKGGKLVRTREDGQILKVSRVIRNEALPLQTLNMGLFLKADKVISPYGMHLPTELGVKLLTINAPYSASFRMFWSFFPTQMFPMLEILTVVLHKSPYKQEYSIYPNEDSIVEEEEYSLHPCFVNDIKNTPGRRFKIYGKSVATNWLYYSSSSRRFISVI